MNSNPRDINDFGDSLLFAGLALKAAQALFDGDIPSSLLKVVTLSQNRLAYQDRLSWKC